jgi:hypothetical protein
VLASGLLFQAFLLNSHLFLDDRVLSAAARIKGQFEIIKVYLLAKIVYKNRQRDRPVAFPVFVDRLLRPDFIKAYLRQIFNDRHHCDYCASGSR